MAPAPDVRAKIADMIAAAQEQRSKARRGNVVLIHGLTARISALLELDGWIECQEPARARGGNAGLKPPAGNGAAQPD